MPGSAVRTDRETVSSGRKRERNGGESGGRLTQKRDADVVHVAPFRMPGNGPARQLAPTFSLASARSTWRLGEIWIGERGFDDQSAGRLPGAHRQRVQASAGPV